MVNRRSGAIIRKGGLGMPVVVSVGSFRHRRRRGDFGMRQSGIV